MKILFLDQSGKLGGAEFCLADLAKFYAQDCLVGLFADGSFRELLERQHTPVRVLMQQSINVQKDSGTLQGLRNLSAILPLILKIARIAQNYDLIYANTQKAFVIGAIVSLLTRQPLVYHLHDILSPDHFSTTNRRIAVTLANRCAAQVIANSKATANAFIEAGGRPELIQIVYNGFDLNQYQLPDPDLAQLRCQFELKTPFVVGHFSRLSPWKGQHILLEALTHCTPDVGAVFVGDALFGEQDYAQSLRQQVAGLGLADRVKFLGFRPDVIPLMSACDLIAHTSTAPEPFGRVIVEAMLCHRPVVAAAAGGATELIEPDQTGWLTPPGDTKALAERIMQCKTHPEAAQAIAHTAQSTAQQRFNLMTINRQIEGLLRSLIDG